MRIFIFKSEADARLRAFAGDLDGSKLPAQFRPWRAFGSIAPDRDPPYQLPRAQIEEAINQQGFQLWRMKARPKTT
jgi:hypothetical protein